MMRVLCACMQALANRNDARLMCITPFRRILWEKAKKPVYIYAQIMIFPFFLYNACYKTVIEQLFKNIFFTKQ